MIHQDTSLPQHITDAQLSLMDSLTREAIDERLRILENVSGTVYRCVEDLLRLRSALPVTETLNGNPQGHNSEHVENVLETRGDNDNFSPNQKGKGKGVDHGSGIEPAQGSSSLAGSSTRESASFSQEHGSDDSFEMY